MKLTPLFNRIFILPDTAPEKSKGGLFLPEYSQRRPTSGIVIAIGPDVKELKIGMRVFYGEFAPYKQTFCVGKKERIVFIMTENDVIGIIEDERLNHNNPNP